MQIKATVKDTGVSASKIRPLLNLVRGKKVDEALAILKFTPTPLSSIVSKVVRSAAANAENNHQLPLQELRIASIFAGEGRTMKRIRPRSRGRVSPILKRSSHITVIVSEEGS